MKRLLWILLVMTAGSARLLAQSAQFNFSLGAQSVTGWTNIHGDPSLGVITGTAPSGITITSVAQSNWVPNGAGSAYDGVGQPGGTFFSSSVMMNHWYQYGSTAAYNVLVPQLIIGGLTPDSAYTIKMAGSSTTASDATKVQYTVAGFNVYQTQTENNHNNTANGAIFYNVVPDTAGKVRVYVNPGAGTQIGDISGLSITGGRTSQLPKDSITSPKNGAVLGENSNLLITANASIDTGTIRKVDFYHDTTLIGTSTTAPYSVTWFNPDPGSYQLIAVATDYIGRTATSTIQITIESMNYFWSTSGNITTNGDTNFIGTVDTNRLSFRTNNVERMTILKDGTIGIGTKNTYGYQLAVNGTAIFTKAKVKTAGTWPDYVFEKNYSLPDLTALEQYLLAHHHLPEIPAQNEVQQDGIDLSQHASALLKKVEELTLYLIQENKTLTEQNRRLSEQDARLEAQQKEIDELKALIKDKKN